MKVYIDKQYPSKELFVGRSEELKALKDAILYGGGGTVLVSGDRGSGKSRLIKHAIEEITPKKASFLNKTIHVEIPLITFTDGEQHLLRGLLLRSIIHALWAEYTSKPWVIRNRPFGYGSKLKELRNRTEYSRMSSTRTLGAVLSHSSQANISGTLQKSWERELDLSDIKLELYLTDFLKKYGTKYRFVIVFDELDKFEDDRTNPISYINELKNFFTATKATFIFVTTESFYGKLQEQIASSPYSKEHTLFSRRFLINQIPPSEVNKLLDKTFIAISDKDIKKAFEKLKLMLMWQSNLYPYDLYRSLEEVKISGDEPYVDIEEAEKTFGEDFEFMVMVLSVMNYVYAQNSKDRDDYFNRYLYKSLKEVANRLVQGKEFAVRKSDFISSIFNVGDFENESGYDAFIISGDLKNTTIRSWKNNISILPKHDVSSIEKAILLFLWLCERLGLEKAAPESGKDILIFSRPNVRIKEISARLIEKAERDQIVDEDILNKIPRSEKIAQSYHKKGLGEIIDTDTFKSYESGEYAKDKSSYRHRFLFNSFDLRKALDDFYESSKTDFINRIDGVLMVDYGRNSTVADDDKEIGRSIKMSLNQEIRILIAFDLLEANQKQLLQSDDYHYIVSICDDPSINYQKSPKFKKIIMNRSWNNYDTVLDELKAYLGKIKV